MLLRDGSHLCASLYVCLFRGTEQGRELPLLQGLKKELHEQRVRANDCCAPAFPRTFGLPRKPFLPLCD